MKKSYDAKLFAQRLKRTREIRGISIAALAKKIGVTPQSLSRYENAERAPNARILYDISAYFGVTSDYLLGLPDVQTQDEEIYAACSYTGLSTKTVMTLRNAKKDKTEGGIRRMEAIKCLLEDFERDEK